MEHFIDEPRNLLFASEVAVQIYLDAFLFFRTCIKCVFSLEYLRLSQSELIYALLHVAYHEQVIAPAYPACDSFLKHIAVLEFIYEYIFELISVFGRSHIIAEDLDGIMHDIVKIHHISFLFLHLE